MTDLAAHLERLGLEQYLDALVAEGFDTWETLLDVQESDLQTLGVKLGHRRVGKASSMALKSAKSLQKLQRAIADHRGISYERLIGSPGVQEPLNELTRLVEGSHGTSAVKEGSSAPPAEAKRKYRRHPKPDDNAPDKPPSAYVLFSNKVREDVKAENLSFTEIAKLVGDRWQKLDPSQKEPFETQAATLKDSYNIQLSAYKKTDAYKEYAQYLSDFKAKHGQPTEPKRPKLDPQSSGGSLSATSVDMPDIPPVASGTSAHGRVGSIGSASATSLTSFASAVASPPVAAHGPAPSLTSLPSISSRAIPSLHRPSSPQLPQYVPARRLVGQMSNHSSISDDSGPVLYDPLSRTATLSLSTPPTGTPPLPSHVLGPTRPDQSGLNEPFQWPARGSQSTPQQGSITPSAPSPLGPSITLPSPTIPNESWRDRGMDWTRQIQPSSATGGPGAALPLPPFLGPDRMPDLSHGHVQRTLPPLRQNTASSLSSSTHQGSPSISHLSRQVSGDTERRHSQTYEGGTRPLDRSENEAANTLAGLAVRPSSHETPESRSYGRPRPQ